MTLDKHWRLKSGAVTWRLALPSDAMAMAGLVVDMQERTGVERDCPDMFAWPVMITLVAEDDSGTIVGAVYMEAIAEIKMLNFNRDAFTSAEALLPLLAGLANERKIRWGRVSTKHWIQRRVSRMLRAVGFELEPDRMDHWLFRVRD